MKIYIFQIVDFHLVDLCLMALDKNRIGRVYVTIAVCGAMLIVDPMDPVQCGPKERTTN